MVNDGGRKGRRSGEFARNLAIKRAFLRQAESLNRHEERIAGHTAIQSWTNIIAVVMSVITTAALGWIAWGQWQSSRRDVELEYARSRNQYAFEMFDLKVSKADYGDRTLATAFPQRSRLQVIRGDEAVTTLRSFMILEVRDRLNKGDERDRSDVCEVAINLFTLRDEGDGVVYHIGGVSNPIDLVVSELKVGVNPYIRFKGVNTYISFYDVFGRLKIDRIEAELNGFNIFRDSDLPALDGEVLPANGVPIVRYWQEHAAVCGRYLKS